jgi:CNT family concentrative nucleoside transporter
MEQLQSAFGIVALLAIAWAISENRRAVSPRQVATGIAVTFATAMLFLKVPQVTAGFFVINRAVDAIADASRAGTSFVFGYVGAEPCRSSSRCRAPSSASRSRRCRWCW